MKILMLGHSGVGKTTFMACMYAALQEGVGGFKVRAKDSSTHKRLCHMASEVEKGRYPERTSQLGSYDLGLHHGGGGVIDFEWIDYRGGALEESASSASMQELLEHLSEADGLIAFFDGPSVAAGGRTARNVVGRIMVLVQKAIETKERVIPVALVVTKADLLADPDPIYDALEPLGRAISNSRTVYGALIFTSCGQGFSKNMDKPTLFVLYRGLFGLLARMKSELEETREKAARYQSKAGLWDWIDSKLSGVSTYGEMAERENANANEMVDRHNRLVDPANALATVLEDVAQF